MEKYKMKNIIQTKNEVKNNFDTQFLIVGGILIVLAVLVLISGEVNAATVLTDCGTLNNPGETYLLANDVINSNKTRCMEFAYNDITLDCQGHSIGGISTPEEMTHGIYADDKHGITIKNCILTKWDYGIYLYGSGNNITSNSINLNDLYGIYLMDSSDNSIINNTVTSNNNNGIYLQYSSQNTIINNTVTFNNYYGILLEDSSDNTLLGNDLTKNKVYSLFDNGNGGEGCNNVENNTGGDIGKPIRYEHDKSGINISDTNEYSEIIFCNVRDSIISNVTISNPESTSDGIIFVYSDNNVIENSNLHNNYHGIYLRNSLNNELAGNTVNSNYYRGIYLRHSDSNTLIENTAELNDYGIYLDNAKSNNITGNTVNLNKKSGMYLSNSDENALAGNTANLNKNYGVYLSYSIQNNIINNTANSNDETGIYISTLSKENEFTGNFATLNGQHGLYIPTKSSTNNTINSNILCLNNQSAGNYYDISDADSNTGDENTCDLAKNWDDTGANGCTNSCHGITLTKNADELIINSGETVTYNYTVTNTGLYNLTNITLYDDKLGNISCPKSILQSGESMQCEADATLNVTTTNIADVTALTPIPLNTITSANANETVVVIHPNITLTKNASVSLILPGQTVTYY
ncbi:MAG: hypothetical protein CVT90_02555, partial [Candidatus Altiarchaeales archaeon HGW-Altiarchaeales-3]